MEIKNKLNLKRLVQFNDINSLTVKKVISRIYVYLY